MRFEIAGVGLQLHGPPPILEAMRGRFAAFAVESARPDDVTIEMAALHAEFEPDLRLDLELAAHATAGRDGITLRGAATGRYDPAARHGWLDAPRNLGEIDGMIRLALSFELPRRRALLLHAAAVIPHQRESAVVLTGPSGAGKSTSARALGRALCDELSVILVGDPPSVAGTPYWNGKAERAALDRIVVLERGGQGPAEPLTGGRAVAALAANVIRYASDEAFDRVVFALCADLCARARLWRVRCPEGDAFLPHLVDALGLVLI